MVARALTAHLFTESYTRTSVVRGIFRTKAEARAEALEPLPAARRPGVGRRNKSKRLSDTDCVRTSPDPGNRLILCKAWRMSRSLTASRLRLP
jgi:hypothetical protein